VKGGLSRPGALTSSAQASFDGGPTDRGMKAPAQVLMWALLLGANGLSTTPSNGHNRVIVKLQFAHILEL